MRIRLVVDKPPTTRDATSTKQASVSSPADHIISV